MRNTFEPHPESQALKIPCESRHQGLPEVAEDMSKLWGGDFHTAMIEREGFRVVGHRMRNPEGNVIATYEPGALRTHLEIREQTDAPLQRTRWAAVILYAEHRGALLPYFKASFYGSDPEKKSELKLDNSVLDIGGTDIVMTRRFPDLLKQSTEDVFKGEEGKMALAGLVGATHFDIFCEAWQMAASMSTPLAAAQLLLNMRGAFYQPE